MAHALGTVLDAVDIRFGTFLFALIFTFSALFHLTVAVCVFVSACVCV